jgi:hypothetical protein
MSHNQRSNNAPSGPVWEITNKAAVPDSPSLTVTREKASEERSEDVPGPAAHVTEAPPTQGPPVLAPAAQDAPAQAPLSSPELRRVPEEAPLEDAAPSPDPSSKPDAPKKDASSPRKRHGGAAAAADGPIETLTYRDPFAGVYKKYIFSADGKYLLGGTGSSSMDGDLDLILALGMMVGDTSDYVKLVALVKKKVRGTQDKSIIS